MVKERLRAPRAGEVAPDFTLPDVEGGVVKLSDCPKPVAAVFLRHLS
jgi:peroxiredoxin